MAIHARLDQRINPIAYAGGSDRAVGAQRLPVHWGLAILPFIVWVNGCALPKQPRSI